MSGRDLRFLSRLLIWAALIGYILPAPAAAQFSALQGLVNKAKAVGKVGDSFRKISPDEEVKLGGDLAGLILGAAPLVKDERKQRYVNRLGHWLAMHSERADLPWKFGVIDSPDFNAFSMPGGYVLVTSGLLDRMRNESELAGVLAHEIAHVVRRHHIAALQRTVRNEGLSDMEEYFHPVGAGGLSGQFATALMNAGRTMYTQGLDEGDEYEADRMGVVIAARSGFSPFGLAGVLQTLSDKAADPAYALDAKTHPEPVKRLDQLNAAMGTRLDAVPGVVDNAASFDALRAPPPAVAPSGAKKKGKKAAR